MSKVEEAVIAHWGERCADTMPGCPCCDAWIEYDAIRETTLREAADELKGQGYNTAVRQILALIEKGPAG